MVAKYVDMEKGRKRKSQLTKICLQKNTVLPQVVVVQFEHKPELESHEHRPELEALPTSGKDKRTNNKGNDMLLVKAKVQYSYETEVKHLEDENGPELESHPIKSTKKLKTNKENKVFVVEAQVHCNYETGTKSDNSAEKEMCIKDGNTLEKDVTKELYKQCAAAEEQI